MDNLLREEFLEIYKHPAHKGTLQDPSVVSSGKNPMCGDEIRLQLKIENGRITDVKYDGIACSVSVISSDILSEELIGKTLEDVRKIDKDKLLELIGLNLTTSRVKCATLVLDSLKTALDTYEQKR
jgi:nitrogen fixation NifU-like protein